MLGATPALIEWFWVGLRESLAMIWLTFWPLVLGFSLSGLLQSMVPRDGLRRRLGGSSAKTAVAATLLGVISSSCSYAASALARATFARGASFRNSLIFMVASTNLVIELGVVLYLLLGWPFLLAELVGGVVMVALLAVATRLLFSADRERALLARVLGDAPPSGHGTAQSWRVRLATRDSYVDGARYTIGDLTMLRRELVLGFVVAGFLSVHVPASWWSHVFLSGHGIWTAVENAALAPLVAVLACVCSVGNIPLAAALWGHGVAFGGVVAFIFADLIALPLLFIYRRFYGTGTTLRLLALLWVTMSLAGILVNALFGVGRLIPASHHLQVLTGDFPLGATLVLNVLALVVLVATWLLARTGVTDARLATDPVCGMSVDVSAPAATATREGVTYYFCSLRCRDRFEAGEATAHEAPTADPTAVDPVCGMSVDVSAPAATATREGVTYYFCSLGCRDRFEAGEATAHEAPTADPTAVDPVCGMNVSPADALSADGRDGLTYYFCAEGCRVTFLESQGTPRTTTKNEGDQ